MRTVMVALQLGAVMEELLGTITKPEGVSVSEAMVMAWCAELEWVSCSKLAWNLGRDRSNVQHTLQSLERRGLVQRDREPGQPWLVAWGLTEAGDAVWRIVGGRLRLQEQALELAIPDLPQRVDDLLAVVDALHREKGKRTAMGENLYLRPRPNELTRRSLPQGDDVPY